MGMSGLPWDKYATLSANMTRNALAYFSPSNTQERKDTKNDINLEKKGALGYSEAQKGTALAASLNNIRAQSASAMDANARAGAAANSDGSAGKYFQSNLGIATAGMNQAGAIGAQIQGLSDQKAQAQHQHILDAAAAVRAEGHRISAEDDAVMGGANQAPPSGGGDDSQTDHWADAAKISKSGSPTTPGAGK